VFFEFELLAVSPMNLAICVESLRRTCRVQGLIIGRGVFKAMLQNDSDNAPREDQSYKAGGEDLVRKAGS
jgi:hypothetical protein